MRRRAGDAPAAGDSHRDLACPAHGLAVFFEAVILYRAEPAGQPVVPVGYVTTAVISHLAIQVLTVRPDAGIAGVLIAPGPWDQALLPGWAGPRRDPVAAGYVPGSGGYRRARRPVFSKSSVTIGPRMPNRCSRGIVLCGFVRLRCKPWQIFETGPVPADVWIVPCV
jgi:hypothetical protein